MTHTFDPGTVKKQVASKFKANLDYTENLSTYTQKVPKTKRQKINEKLNGDKTIVIRKK